MISFPHHTFAPKAASAATDGQRQGCSVEIISADAAKPVAEPCPEDVGDVPQRLRDAGITRIVLVHGTFAGNDIVGMVRELARFSHRLAGHLNQLGKRWFDELIGEVGNYAQSYADCLSMLINQDGTDVIEVSRFHWSGENHHLGRADGVMSLLEMLATDESKLDERILIFAHSHGGNLVSMMSQLLGSDLAMRREFFEATDLHYRIPILGKVDLPTWQCTREKLLDEQFALPPIDVATFGTPLRYRWNTDVFPHLLHFVQHRPLNSDDPQTATLPNSIQDVMHAAGGDYVQHLGIAGTDFLPSVFAWRDWVVERRMRRMFEPGARRRDVIKNLKLGQRASCDGSTLLVDYADSEDAWNRKLFGHGVYTCRQWLPFHLREIATRFYGVCGK
jgi:hypothetical protein